MACIFLGGTASPAATRWRGAGGKPSVYLVYSLVCLAASQLGGGTLDKALNTVKEEESSTYWPALPHYWRSPEFVSYRRLSVRYSKLLKETEW